MRKISMIAAIAAAALALLSSCEDRNESITSSSELVSSNPFDSYILLSANEDISDSELDEAARIFGRRADELQMIYRTDVDYDSDSVRIDLKYEDDFADKLLETITDKNIIEFRKGSDYSTSELIFDNDDIAEAHETLSYDDFGDKLYTVAVEFDDEASEILADVTEELMGTDIPLSIWFNGELICAPMVNTKIETGSAIITGNFDIQSASELAEKIKSEPLKYDFSVAEYEFETAYK
ncbi:MAG: hypothetical protein IJY19_08725 [Ruminococcus sp.]|nr:hypothetical protein [Ruminococcus sp.]